MSVQVLNDFHGDGVFRDQQGAIWVRQSEMVEGMARAWSGAVDHVEGMLGGGMKRAAHADNPYTREEQ